MALCITNNPSNLLTLDFCNMWKVIPYLLKPLLFGFSVTCSQTHSWHTKSINRSSIRDAQRKASLRLVVIEGLEFRRGRGLLCFLSPFRISLHIYPLFSTPHLLIQFWTTLRRWIKVTSLKHQSWYMTYQIMTSFFWIMKFVLGLRNMSIYPAHVRVLAKFVT